MFTHFMTAQKTFWSTRPLQLNDSMNQWIWASKCPMCSAVKVSVSLFLSFIMFLSLSSRSRLQGQFFGGVSAKQHQEGATIKHRPGRVNLREIEMMIPNWNSAPSFGPDVHSCRLYKSWSYMVARGHGHVQQHKARMIDLQPSCTHRFLFNASQWNFSPQTLNSLWLGNFVFNIQRFVSSLCKLHTVPATFSRTGMAIYGWSTDSLIAANHIKVDDITTLSTSTEVSYLRQWNFDAENLGKTNLEWI